jgi:hypothetical protein
MSECIGNIIESFGEWSSMYFRDSGSTVYSASGYGYQKLADYRAGITVVDDRGQLKKEANFELSTGRKIVVEALLIPLVLLSGIETVARGALYLFLSPAIIGFFLFQRDPNEDSVPETILVASAFILIIEGVQASFCVASIKAIYLNIFNDPLPIPMQQKGKEDKNLEQAVKFLFDELICCY